MRLTGVACAGLLAAAAVYKLVQAAPQIKQFVEFIYTKVGSPRSTAPSADAGHLSVLEDEVNGGNLRDLLELCRRHVPGWSVSPSLRCANLCLARSNPASRRFLHFIPAPTALPPAVAAAGRVADERFHPSPGWRPLQHPVRGHSGLSSTQPPAGTALAPAQAGPVSRRGPRSRPGRGAEGSSRSAGAAGCVRGQASGGAHVRALSVL